MQKLEVRMQKWDSGITSAFCLLTSAFFFACYADLRKCGRGARTRCLGRAPRWAQCPDGVTLMAVTKTQPPERIREAYERRDFKIFGESRVQEFAGKVRYALRDLKAAEWHMIGHLQTNKAAKTAELFRAPWIQSIH
jgi:hypothetical protein